MNRMPGLVQGDGRDNGDLVLRSATSLAPQLVSAKTEVVDLDLSPQQIGVLYRSAIARKILLCSSQAVSYFTPK